MSQPVSPEIREQVYQRAKGCCEYCQTAEVNSGQQLQIDHILPQDGNALDNLCLACWSCNSYKHRATSALDPLSQTTVALYHPRRETWTAHFQWAEQGSVIVGLTACGRATIERLKMNRPIQVLARRRWVQLGFHPPHLP